MIYNKISGSILDANIALLFKEFNDEQCFLALGRADETWGMCTLMNISIPTASINEILPRTENGILVKSGYFVDKKIDGYTTDDASVRIYKTAGSVPDFDPDFSKYESIKVPEMFSAELQLQYINENWCVLKNFPSNYIDFISNVNGEKFYIVTRQTGDGYPENPESGSRMVKINNKGMFNYASISEKLKMYVSKMVGNTRTDSLFISNITKTVNILGEISYTGLSDSFFDGISESDLLEDVNNDFDETRTYFYFVNKNNFKVSDNFFLQQYLKPDGTPSVFNFDTFVDKKYLLFNAKNRFATPANTYYMKLGYESAQTELAIYHETLPFLYPNVNSTNNISDANPPGLDISYLKNSQVNRSLFEIGGYVKIKKDYNSGQTQNENDLSSKVSFVREMETSNDKNLYIGMGFTTDTSSSKRIESVVLTGEPTIKYANVVAKPNGTPYASGDRRLYLDTNAFIVGDVLNIDVDMSNPSDVSDKLKRTVTEVNYNEGYIGLNESLGTIVAPNSNPFFSDQIVSDETTVIDIIEYAVCDSYKDALRYGMNSVMVDLKLPAKGNGLYEGIYRQIAICHRPQYLDIATNTIKNCADSTNVFFTDTDGTSLYIDGEAKSNHAWEAGTVLYIANKTPIYRKYVKNRESFKLII
jgi:hypothetical protein